MSADFRKYGNQCSWWKILFNCPEAKIWLRSRMNQERLSNLTVLNIDKARSDSLSTIEDANEFTDRNTDSVILALFK